MAFFPVTTTENEIVCPEPDLATFANEECTGFLNDWCTPSNVESAVSRGKQLRECKPPAPRQSEIRFGVEVDYIRPCTEKKRSFRRCCQRPCYDIYNTPCPPAPLCGCCPQTSTARSQSCKRSNPCLPHHQQCPLRIMELAAPTKRHCLDTWRSKCHVLPDIMVERVRQYVMDEKPLVEIPDAINCFKRCCTSRSSKRCKPRISDACMTDIRKFSAVFAYCVAQKLDKPLNIILNPELDKISKIVSYDISAVNKKNRKYDKGKINKFDSRMQDEMSKKVTVWIDNVLDDTKEKLLQDELNELEEKEGPVLDILDDLIDKVLDSFEPPEDYTSGNITGNDSETDSKSEKSNTGSFIIATSATVESKVDDETNDLSIGNSNDELHQAELDVTESYTDIAIDNLNIPADGLEAVPDGLDTEEDLTGETANVSETFKKYSEESLDEQNLTVKFSNIGVRGGIGTIRRSPQNITFAPPNKNLLSAADEVWPQHIPKVSEKPSAIVSKSITSLGFLDEKEEKKSMADGDSEKMTKHSTEKQDGVKPVSERFDADTLKKIEIEEVEVHQSNLRDASALKFEDKRLTSTNGIMEEGKVDYKVDARTAPSWVSTGRCDYSCGDSEDSIQEDRSRDENEICERYLRIWATNLEIMCANLQIWLDWIEITCKNMRHIKRKSERYRSTRTCICREKDVDCWIKLNRYIKKDAEFWFKIKRKEKRRLNTYKCIYKHRAKHSQTAIDLNKCLCEKN